MHTAVIVLTWVYFLAHFCSGDVATPFMKILECHLKGVGLIFLNSIPNLYPYPVATYLPFPLPSLQKPKRVRAPGRGRAGSHGFQFSMPMRAPPSDIWSNNTLQVVPGVGSCVWSQACKLGLWVWYFRILWLCGCPHMRACVHAIILTAGSSYKGF